MFSELSQAQPGSLRCFRLGERHGDPGLLCQLREGGVALSRCFLAFLESLLCVLPGIELSPYPWHDAGLGGDFFCLEDKSTPACFESPTTMGEEQRM